MAGIIALRARWLYPVGMSTGLLTLTGGALVVAAAWLAGVVGVAPSAWPVIQVLPELGGLLVVLLALRFRRSRLAAAALLVVAAGRVAGWGPGAGSPAAAAFVGSLLPVGLMLLGPAEDHGLLSLRGVLQVAGTPLAGLVLAAAGSAAPAGSVGRAILAFLASPEVILWCLLVGVVVLAAGWLVRRGTVEAGLLVALLAAAVAARQLRDGIVPDPALAAAQVVLLLAVVEEVHRLAYHDELTGLPGRRAFEHALSRLGGTYALAMVDIDHFKRFNDRYGHEAGDQVLRMVARELSRVGAGGRTFRYGGEEFAIVFPSARLDAARTAVEAVREAIARRPFRFRGEDRPRKKPKKAARGTRRSSGVGITVSAGVAAPAPARPGPSEVLAAADKALYRAKRQGRNRVAVAR